MTTDPGRASRRLRRRLWRHAVFMVALAALACISLPVPAAPAALPKLQELLAFLRQRLPSSGVVEALFDQPGAASVRELIVFDVGFGSFYSAGTTPTVGGAEVFGLSATGRSFNARLASGAPEILGEERHDDSAIEGLLPFIILYDLVRRKDLQDQATSVERADDGTWTIVLSLPQRLRRPPAVRDPAVLSLLKPVDVAYRINSSARIIALRYGPPTSPWREVEYPADTASPVAPVARSTVIVDGREQVYRRLVKWTFTPTSDPAPFEPDAALARARTEVQPLPDADPAKNNPAWDGVKIDQWTKDRAAALAASPTVPRKPLPWLNIILGTFGVAVLATAAFLWLRRRGAAA
ncbi:MAG: hypothetical protein IBJ11_07870 [Phycisphaerales bacterium]|nr:hypothetical protein [Phycisphaerales bacterium]